LCEATVVDALGHDDTISWLAATGKLHLTIAHKSFCPLNLCSTRGVSADHVRS
jgi:hypothetical protein